MNAGERRRTLGKKERMKADRKERRQEIGELMKECDVQ